MVESLPIMRFGTWIDGTLHAFLVVSWIPFGSVNSRPGVLTSTTPPQQRLPIIFIPGKGGSQIEAEVDRTGLWDDQGLPECEKKLDRYRMWMDLWTLFTHGVDCWSQNTQLKFDSTTREYSNFPGVRTWIPGWGNTDTIEYIDPSWTAWVLGNVGLYAKYFIDGLVFNGYERGLSVRGAPYDFRYAPHSQPFYFVQLQQLVEETCAINGRRKVVLIAHSMGGLYAAYFLSRQTGAWKDRYIEALVTVNTPWAGTVVAIQMQAAGYNWEIDAFDRLVIRDQQRSFESTFLLVPTSTSGIWTSTDIMLITPLRNYSVNDYPSFFDAIGYPEGRLKLEAIQSADHNFTDQDLGVPIYCFYSKGTPTPERLVYDSMSTFPDSEPLVEMGEGDGTVNLRSLEACRRWQYVQHKHPVIVKHYADIGHHELLHLPSLISDVLRVAIKQTQ